MEDRPVEANLNTVNKSVHTSSVVYSGFVFGAIAAIFVCIIILHTLVSAPQGFRVPSTIIFSENQTASDLIGKLKSEGYIT